MTFQVRLYIHHDNDLIQLHLNGVRLCDVFAKSLEAHYKKEQFRFMLPEKMEFKPHKGKVYRVKVTLNDRKQGDLIEWVCAFPDQYKCHCIKNIARSYLGTTVIDALNGMVGIGTWMPDSGNQDNKIRTVPLKKWKKKTDEKDDGVQWIDQVSASRKKTAEQIRRAKEERERIRNLPIEEILGIRKVFDIDAEEVARGGKNTTYAGKKAPQTSKRSTASQTTAGAVSGKQDAGPSADVTMPADSEWITEPADGHLSDTSPSITDAILDTGNASPGIGNEADGAQDDGGDFDALRFFEQIRL